MSINITKAKIPVELTVEEYNALKSLLDVQIKYEQETSIDTLIAIAKKYKIVAKELYPNEQIDIYIEKSKKQIFIDVANKNNLNDVKVQLEIRRVYNEKYKVELIPYVSERIYV